VLLYHAACWEEGGLAAVAPEAEADGHLVRGRVFLVVGIGCTVCGEPLAAGDRIRRVMAVPPEPPHFFHARCAQALGHA